MDPQNIPQIFEAIGAILTAIGVISGFYIYRRQQQAQTFLEYTKRFETIMESLPEDALSARL